LSTADWQSKIVKSFLPPPRISSIISSGANIKLVRRRLAEGIPNAASNSKQTLLWRNERCEMAEKLPVILDNRNESIVTEADSKIL